MTCRELKDDLDAYIDGELEPGRQGGLEAHAGRCAVCARAVEDRRVLSGRLAAAFGKALEGVEPRSGEREALAERMAQASKRRLVVPARIAAAAVIGVLVGLVASAVGLSRATPEELAVAETLRDRDTRGAQILQLRNEAEADLRFVRGTAEAGRRKDAAALALDVGASTIERRLEPSNAPPPDAAAAKERRLSVKGVVGGAAVEVVQMGDGRVTLAVPGRTIEASSMADLLRKHGDVCRTFGVQGTEGMFRVGENAAATDLKGRLHLLWRTGSWDEDAQWEAARSWMSGRMPDAAEMEKRIREMRERYATATILSAPPAIQMELGKALAEVKGRSRRELEETRARVAQEMKRLEREFEDLKDLRGRAKGLRAFAEAVVEPKTP